MPPPPPAVCLYECARTQFTHFLLFEYTHIRTTKNRDEDDSSNKEIALRNEEINRRREHNNRQGSRPQGKISDPAALRRVMADLRSKYDQVKRVQEERENERKKREGVGVYKPPEERAREAKEAKEAARRAAAGEGEARVLANHEKFDPKKDYYAVLGVDRFATPAQIKQKFKRTSLLFHPDKMKGVSDEEKAAIEAKFNELSFAYEVLVDEEKRVLYDKCQDYSQANPGQGLPPGLSQEEMAMMAAGASELRKMRTIGPKLGKHPPIVREMHLTLQQLNYGCTVPITVERRRVDYSGVSFSSPRTFVVVVRKGSREGDKVVFDDEGEETPDTHPGDAIFILRATPHPVFRRRGDKDIEVFAAAVPAGDVVYGAEVEMLSGKKRIVVVQALLQAILNKGMGGVVSEVMPRLGLFDAKEPYDAPPGDLHVHIRYPPVLLSEKRLITSLTPGKVFLLGSADDMVPAAATAGVLCSALKHSRECKLLLDERFYHELVKVVVVEVGGTGTENGNGSDDNNMAIDAIKAVLRDTFRSSVDIHTLHIQLENIISDTKGPRVCDDAAWAALHVADCIVLNGSCDTAEDEYRQALQDIGVLQTMWKRHWEGAVVVGVSHGCALLGHPSINSHGYVRGHGNDGYAILPWYTIRVIDSQSGYRHIHTAAAETARLSVVVGVIATAAYLVDTYRGTGDAELIVAPRQEILIDRMNWKSMGGDDNNDDNDPPHDYGYFFAI